MYSPQQALYPHSPEMKALGFLIFLAPNTLIVATLLSWLLSAFEAVKKKQVARKFWVLQITLTIFLPQLKLTWPPRGLLRYLPGPFFPFADSAKLWPYLHIAFGLLPAIVAMAAIFVTRRPSAYILLASATAYVLIVLAIAIFFAGGAVA
jgi:hypothetical protein